MKHFPKLLQGSIEFMTMACLCLVFYSCNKDSDSEESTVTDADVRYEASVADPVNYKIQVGYMDENGSPLKQIVVESPFLYEMKAKHGTYCYISVMPIQKVIGVGSDTKVNCKMYIDSKLHKEQTGDFSAIIQYIYGQEN
jgi:hypothetical protein